uniref:Uncharacterized protein n=1 Tax=Arundo donax TaxID=35708 RepID=A0A0A9F0X3_ARUDO
MYCNVKLFWKSRQVT